MQDDLLRYSCQLALPGFNTVVQNKLGSTRVLVVGIGGLGCPVSQYLTAVGIGTIGLADADVISVSNLHRQILFTPADAGQKKVAIAAKKLQQQNPGIRIVPHPVRITSHNVMDLYSHYDIIVDCTDNFDTRFLLNDAAVLTNKPLVYGAIYQFEGQVAVWNMINADGSFGPNYRDVFPDVDASQVPDCSEGGVLPTIAGIIGCMQANEVIKIIIQSGDVLGGKLCIVNALSLESRIIKLRVTENSRVTSLTETELVETVSPAKLKSMMVDGEIELVDVRSREERQLYDIGGVHMPLEQLEQNAHLLNSSHPIVFYCTSGKRSEAAVKIIKHILPSTALYSLEGGTKAWIDSSF